MKSSRSFHIVFEDGSTETLLLTALRQDDYRAEESSMLGEFRYNDVIEARTLPEGSLQFVGIVAPSGLITNSWILPKEMIESQDFRPILASVMLLGGNWERVFGGLLLVHLPPDVADGVKTQIDDFPKTAEIPPAQI